MVEISGELKDISKELYELAEKKAKEQMTKFIQEKQKSLNEEVNELARLLEEVENHVIYKKVDNKYILITKDILFEDFQKEDKWSSRKINYNKNITAYEHYVKVGTEYYYHVGNIIQVHLRDIDKAIEKSSWEIERLREKREIIERIEKQHKNIISLYTEYENAIKEKERE